MQLGRRYNHHGFEGFILRIGRRVCKGFPLHYKLWLVGGILICSRNRCLAASLAGRSCAAEPAGGLDQDLTTASSGGVRWLANDLKASPDISSRPGGSGVPAAF